MASIRRAFLVATFERYFSAAVGLLSVPIMSRLLTPREIGVWVVALAIGMLASAAREFASDNFIIQKSDLTREDARSAFTIMAAVTIVIASLLAASAPWFAVLYQSEGVTSCLRVIAIAFLLELLATPRLALLRRDMSFGRVAIINAAGATVNVGVTLSLAAYGFGYMSYAWGWLSGTAISSAVAVYLRPDIWIFRPSLKKWRGPLVFGGYYGLNVVLFRAYDSFLYVLTGRMLSLDAAALFQRAVTIVQLPDRFLFGGLAALALPGFSAHAREGGSLKAAYLRAIEYVTGVQWPALVLLVILAHPAVEIALGHQWLDTVPAIRVLSIAALFSFASYLNYALLVAVGAMKDNTSRALIIVPVSIVILVCASMFGLIGIAISQIIIKAIEAVVSFCFIRRNVPIQWSDLALALRKSAVVSLCSALGAAIGIVAEFRPDISIATAFLSAFLGAAGWLFGLWLCQHPLLDEMRRATHALRRGPLGKRVIDPISNPHR